MDKTLPELTLEEIAKHNTKLSAWTIYKGKVYDISNYLPKHPGGSKIVEPYLGKDCTAAYNKIHGYVKIDAIIGKNIIGTVKKN